MNSTITAAENVTVGQEINEQGQWVAVVGREQHGDFVTLDLVAEGNAYRYLADEPVEVRTPEREHVILVAFEVVGTDRKQAEFSLHRKLVPVLRSQDEASPIESWWVAEDERQDGSDCDSAVFVKPGSQEAAVALLREHGLAY